MIPADRLTVKAAEALQAAATLARQAGNPAVEDVHLLSALLDQDGGIVVPVLQKIGVDSMQLRTELEAKLDRLPRQSNASPIASRELSGILDRADADHARTRHRRSDRLAAARNTRPSGSRPCDIRMPLR